VSAHYGTIAFTDDVRDAQSHNGSRELYARVQARSRAGPGPDALTDTEREFLAERDGFYRFTVAEIAAMMPSRDPGADDEDCCP
jgi:hypothetical protein